MVDTEDQRIGGPLRGTKMKIRNHTTTPDGRELGRHLARLCDEAEPAARLKVPELPPQCSSCAFGAGPHVASDSLGTQMDALKCVTEGHKFLCHKPAREGAVCSGWAMLMLAEDDRVFAEVPWPFSDEAATR